MFVSLKPTGETEEERPPTHFHCAMCDVPEFRKTTRCGWRAMLIMWKRPARVVLFVMQQRRMTPHVKLEAPEIMTIVEREHYSEHVAQRICDK